ncbi:MAG TPA: phosphoribosylformylglycinamidine synthase subunit PurQ, partial [Soehngenia sp.]|nr:phosphoribosylformylglycinamidine synthase subunit PurQ [Soehngenia sp.]
AVIDSVARVIALGGDYKRIRLSFQEFYESLGEDPKKWAKPFTSLLGAYKVQKELEIPSIGGKDSMSGSFENINVAPSLFSFAVCVENSENIISQEFKATDSLVIEVMLKRDENDLVDLDSLKYNYSLIKKLVDEKKILSSNVISHGGLAKAIFEMCIGNDIGFKFSKEFDDMYMPSYGNIILEISQENKKDISSLNFRVVGTTQKEKCITIGEENLELALLKEVYLGVLEEIFPIKEDLNGEASNIEYKGSTAIKSTKTIAKPRVLIPVFTGTNGEYDMISSFEECGGEVNTFVLKTFNTETIKKSIRTLSNLIKETQILGLANGYFLGNEPETAAKLLKVIFDDEYLKESVYELLYKNDGLILGIGSGFNALIKLGLIEHGKFVKENELSPSIIYNYSGDFYSNFVDVKVTSKLSPWFNEMEIGHVYTVPVATKEGRVFLNNSKNLIDKGQISTQFIKDGNATYDGLYNPTGSEYAIESMTSPDGRILGTVSSIDRIADGIYKNIDIKGKHKIFESGVNYYK